MSGPVATVAAALSARGLLDREPVSGRFAARCPAHEDDTASLSVAVGRDGRALVHCHAGCEVADVLDGLGLEFADLFDGPPPKRWTNAGLRATGARSERDGRLGLGGTRYLPGAGANERKSLAAKGAKREPWPAPEKVAGRVLFVVEGEPDAVSGASLGLATVGLPGAAKWDDTWAPRLTCGREQVVVICDSDPPGRKHGRWVAEKLAAAAPGCDVRLLDLEPQRDDGYDLSDYAADAHTEQERTEAARLLTEAAGRAERYGRTAAVQAPDELVPFQEERVDGSQGPGRKGGTLSLVSFADVKPERREWLWRYRLPLGRLALLAGPEKVGKTTLLAHLAAEVTRGRLEGDRHGRPARVVIATLEDDDSDLRPMLEAADADLGLVDSLRVTVDDDIPGALRLPAHVGQLTDLIGAAADPPVGLLIIDPIKQAASGRVKDDDEVRRLLGPLIVLARSTGATVLISAHFKKGAKDEDYSAWKVSGSPAWTQVPRAILFLDLDPDGDDGTRILADAGVSGARRQPSLTATISSVDLRAPCGSIETARLVITGESDARAEDMRTGNGISAVARTEAEDFLRQYLSDGAEHDSKLVRCAAADEGIADRTLDRARSKIGVRIRRTGAGSDARSMWSIRGESGESGESQPLQGLTLATPATPATCSADESVEAAKRELGAVEITPQTAMDGQSA